MWLFVFCVNFDSAVCQILYDVLAMGKFATVGGDQLDSILKNGKVISTIIKQIPYGLLIYKREFIYSQ